MLVIAFKDYPMLLKLVNLLLMIWSIHELKKRQEQLQLRRIEIMSQQSDRKVELNDIATISNYVDDLHEILN